MRKQNGMYVAEALKGVLKGISLKANAMPGPGMVRPTKSKLGIFGVCVCKGGEDGEGAQRMIENFEARMVARKEI